MTHITYPLTIWARKFQFWALILAAVALRHLPHFLQHGRGQYQDKDAGGSAAENLFHAVSNMKKTVTSRLQKFGCLDLQQPTWNRQIAPGGIPSFWSDSRCFLRQVDPERYPSFQSTAYEIWSQHGLVGFTRGSLFKGIYLILGSTLAIGIQERLTEIMAALLR